MTEKDVRKTPVLDSFGTDLTKLAKEGKLDPVIGRDKEIKRVGQILSRRKKNNIIIIGFPGIGKTALAHGLAQKIVKQDCSPLLHNKRIVEVDLGALVAGTKYRGQFEERVKAIMNEVEGNPDVILMMDEVHQLIGAGSASGSGDASNLIKPALSSGKMQLIGVTTQDEYQKTIEKDGALNRRFQKIILEPPTAEETVEILNQVKSQYEEHHSVSYSQDTIEYMVKLAERYLADKQFPDKAIDIMDEVGSYVRGERMGLQPPAEIVEKEQLLEQIKAEKTAIVKQQRYEEAAEYRDKERSIIEELRSLKDNWLKSIKEDLVAVHESDVAVIVSAMSGVPVTKVNASENEDLSTLEPRINARVIGQNKAVYAAVKEIQKGRLGIKDPEKPSVLMFLGTTGVGKTELANAIAKEHFDDENALITVNMNEYGEKFSASRIAGAPPGYVGHEDGGELTKKVKMKPYSVILLDEIEKAHPDVWHIFLDVWDKGFLTDSQGFRVDFRNTIFILTSNIGTEKLTKFGKGIGYNKTAIMAADEAENLLLKEVEKGVKAELLNRIDDIIVFNMLDKDSLYKIIDIYLKALQERMTQYFDFTVKDSVKDLIIKHGYNEAYGARPLRRAITKLVENTLVDVILKGVKKGKTVVADVENDKIVYEMVVTKKVKN